MAHFLLVGGSHGIGLALAKDLLQSQHRLSIISRTEPEIEQNITHYSCDVLKDELPSIEEPISGLVYLPGSINLKPFRQLKETDFRHDWELNFLGAVRCIQKYLGILNETQPASIVLASTVAVGRGMAFHASIAAAKGALDGLTRSLAAELAPKLRVNAVAPSLTETPLAGDLLKNSEAAAKRHPLGRIGQAEDIASMIAYLLSDKASWVTGQVIGVDGGLSTLSVF